jgi:hypothetical protein
LFAMKKSPTSLPSKHGKPNWKPPSYIPFLLKPKTIWTQMVFLFIHRPEDSRLSKAVLITTNKNAASIQNGSSFLLQFRMNN